MTRRELHLELLLGKRVVDAAGERVGRVEELIAEQHGDRYLVREFHIGGYAFFERFGGSIFLRALLGKLGLKSRHEVFRVSWDALDLNDPDHPRVDRPKRELERVRV